MTVCLNSEPMFRIKNEAVVFIKGQAEEPVQNYIPQEAAVHTSQR